MRSFTAVLSLLALTSFSAKAANPEAVYKNNEAVKLMEKENHYGAYRTLLKALELEPLNPSIQYNLGIAFLANEEFEKAMKQFDMADKLATNDLTHFNARFAAAVAATKLKNIPEALRYYQMALEIEPDNEDVKKNIELLWQGGGGGGEGEEQNKDQNQEGKQGSKEDQEKQQEKDGKDQNKQGPQPKPQPQQFKSQELTPDQVRKILEELKAQEQKIRADENEKDRKDAPNAKDW